MPSGGHANSGPARDPNALRRDRPADQAGWATLPIRREGDTPEWPLELITSREAHLWADFWTRPQAVIWERDQLYVMVALFVRQLVEAEKPKASAENRKTVRMMFADLYLTPHALANAKYRISDEASPSTSAAPRFRKASTATHLTVVPRDDVA